MGSSVGDPRPALKPALQIDIWSDIACPWCYVGKRRLEAALRQLDGKADVTWHSFELDTEAPRESDASVSYADRLANKYGTSVAQAEGMIRSMTETAARDGLDFHFEKIRPGNTFDAHRLLHLAKTQGKGDALKERFLRGYLTEGHAIGNHDELTELAVEAGLDRDEVRAVLASDRFAKDVRHDEAEAHAIGIRGVPFFVIDRRYGVSGAQPPDVLLKVLREASSEQVAEGAACGPDGCD